METYFILILFFIVVLLYLIIYLPSFIFGPDKRNKWRLVFEEIKTILEKTTPENKKNLSKLSRLLLREESAWQEYMEAGEVYEEDFVQRKNFKNRF